MDDVIVNKVAIIERCLQRINEEFSSDKEFDSNFAKQDSVILNLQRACEASIDLANRLIRTEKLGIPQSAREVFNLLAKENIITSDCANKMQKMIGFRNIAVHDYQQLNLDIVKHIIKHQLDDFNELAKQILLFTQVKSL